MWTWFHKLASPPHAYRLAGLFQPWLFWISAVLMATGIYGGQICLVLRGVNRIENIPDLILTENGW